MTINVNKTMVTKTEISDLTGKTTTTTMKPGASTESPEDSNTEDYESGANSFPSR